MKVRFDFNLNAWIQNLDIEADSLEEAKEQLYKMSLEEILEEGYLDDHDITDLDIDILEETKHVVVSNVVYDYDEDEDDIDIINNLPTEFEFDITVGKKDDIEDLIADEITNETDYLVSNFDYIVKK